MKLFNTHFQSLIRRNDDFALVIGISGGRVNFSPEARWLYSLRILLLVVRFEILWTTGEYDLRIAEKDVRA